MPLDREKLLEAILAALPGRLPAPPRRKRGTPLVLCVDDDRFFLEALGRILQRHGYRTATFLEPERVLESLPRLNPDVAIVDIMMPGMDGLALAQELRELTHDRLPIVFLTARATDQDIATGYEHGGTYYLVKPCEPAKVLNIVDYLVGDLDPEERSVLEAQL
jgi:DNA-binding response OmpR family regulator